MSEPTSFSEFFSEQLDARLAREPNDRARVVVLAKIYGAWTLKYRRFIDIAEQPFKEPHPTLGDMCVFDFANLLALINQKRGRIERLSA